MRALLKVSQELFARIVDLIFLLPPTNPVSLLPTLFTHFSPLPVHHFSQAPSIFSTLSLLPTLSHSSHYIISPFFFLLFSAISPSSLNRSFSLSLFCLSQVKRLHVYFLMRTSRGNVFVSLTNLGIGYPRTC